MSVTDARRVQGELAWEPLFELTLDVAFDRVQKVGAMPTGWRGVYPVDGGTFNGTRLRGRVLPGGADWVVRRSDGAVGIDVRLILETHDGAIIAMTYTGLIVIAADAQARFGKGEPVDYAETYIRTTPRFETGDARYDWLNRVIAVANGGPPGAKPTYQVFAIL